MGGTEQFASRLIALVESDAADLTQRTVEALQTNRHTPSYRKLAFQDLYAKAYDVYHQFGRWLLENADGVIQTRYQDLGHQRFHEGIPLSEVLWALILTKQHLRRHLSAWALADSAVELYRQQELDRLVAQFFDRAVCYTAEGYERAGKNSRRAAPKRAPASPRTIFSRRKTRADAPPADDLTA
jgi:hypothetical protein